MKIGILKERADNRVSFVPEIIAKLSNDQISFIVEKDAGKKAFFDDMSYLESNAKVANRDEVIATSEIVISIFPPSAEELSSFTNKTLISSFQPFNNTYPLSVSAERICQGIALAEYAQQIGASYLAHGSTGAGNDQVRFDLAFALVAPEIEVLTPIRDQKLSRQQEIDYLAQHGVLLDWEKAQYSINKGIWGTSVGGAETLSSHLPLPDHAFPSQVLKQEPVQVSLQFKQGELVGLNGVALSSVEAIQKLDALASQYAIGRDIHVGDTIIGIKGRVGFEAAAASIIIKAHHTLEKHTLSKWQLHWKEQLANWYGMFIHEAQYFEPVMRNIETFLEATQTTVTEADPAQTESAAD